MIVHDHHNPRAVAALAELRRREVPAAAHDGVVVVLGGDGFLLQTVANYGLQMPFLGLNAGSVGFLHNPVDDWDHVVDRLRARDWTPMSFPLLQAEVRCMDGQRRTALMLAARSGHAQVARLLLDHGARAGVRAADGETAATLARRSGHTDLAAHLEQAPGHGLLDRLF